MPTPTPASTTIDLNADLGEGFGIWAPAADAELLPLVTSANIACGFHAGDPVRMRETVALAAAHGVAIGAHPGYPDLQGFGRRELDASPAEIAAYALYQVGALDAVARAAGTRVRYVKPHGALYHRLARDRDAARAFAAAIHDLDRELTVLGPEGSALLAAARSAGLEARREAFIDRGYGPDGILVPRGREGALASDPVAAAERAVRIVREGLVKAVDGTDVPVAADSLCIHGDGRHAAELLRAVRARFEAEGIAVAPFAR
ncbi:MAG TPA: 5-oxoprolinase subunit PxpA [Gemmatimonadales bacterium]|nr:5-oxoprolinase subunit PxpA [Gemmatimonadales bacterium]